MPSMADRQLRLYQQITRAVAFGYPVALCILGWDAAKGKKTVKVFAGKNWHLNYVPPAEDAIIAAIKGGVNAYLMRTVDLGVTVRDADSTEAIAKLRALNPRHVVETPRGGLHAYYLGERHRSDTPGEDTMITQFYGAGSFYERYGSVAEYGGEVPDPAALDPLPPSLAVDMKADRARARVQGRQIKAQSAAAREFERLRERLLGVLLAGRQGLWDRAELLACATHLVKLCGPEVGPKVWDDLFAQAGIVQDDHDVEHIATAVEKYGEAADDVRPDAELPPELAFWAGGRHAGQLAVSADGTITGRNLPAEFWSARPAFKLIRDAAYARSRSADAVLLTVLARLSSMVPPSLRVDTGVGVPASLNLFVALMGSSATGKSTAARLADALFHTEGMVPLDESTVFTPARPIGTGEGLADEYMGTVEDVDPSSGKVVKQRKQVRSHAMFSADEGAAVLEAGARPGSTLLPVIRQAWTGAPFGQKNASVERDRYVADYAMGIWLGLQPTHAARLLSAQSVDEGTLQRFVWASAIDPGVPDEPPEDPGPLKLDPAVLNHTVLGDRMGFPDSLRTELRLQQARVQRGEITPEPGREHEALQRVKVSGLLAILDGRNEITLADWALAGMVLDVSAAVVESVRLHAQKTSRDKERAWVDREDRQQTYRAEKRAQTEETLRNALLVKVLDRPGSTPLQLVKMVAQSSRREVARDMLAELLEDRMVINDGGRIYPPADYAQ